MNCSSTDDGNVDREDRPERSVNGVQSLTPTELARRIETGDPIVLLDVREREEFALARIEGSQWIPLGELAARWRELDPMRPIVCICHHGIRSAHAASALERWGFREIANLSGGLDRWAREVDPSMPRYR
jgi:rhodanese-related sulfurtransferase